MRKRKKHEAVLNVERVAVGDLKPHPKNPREHPKPGSEKWTVLKRSIEHDYFDPIVWNKRNGMLVSGHLRTKVLIEMGVTSVDVVVVDYDEPTHEARLIAANEQAGGWDKECLENLVQGLESQFRELTGLLGDRLHQLSDIGGEEGKVHDSRRAEEMLEIQARWKTEVGQLWLLGEHRLKCGDSTDPSNVSEAIADLSPLLMVTDPPYGVKYDPKWRAKANNDGPNSRRSVGAVSNDDRSDWTEAWNLFRGDVAYVWHSYCHSYSVEGSLIRSGFLTRSQIIWAKSKLVFGRGDYHSQHEACWYSVRSGKPGRFNGDRTQTTLWNLEDSGSEEVTGHSTQKPMECMRRPILNNSKRGEWVYDPFIGSGTTLMAAQETGRKCIGIELDPVYVAMTLERFKKETGIDPVLNQ